MKFFTTKCTFLMDGNVPQRNIKETRILISEMWAGLPCTVTLSLGMTQFHPLFRKAWQHLKVQTSMKICSKCLIKVFQYEFKNYTFRKSTPQLAATILAETQCNHAFSLQNSYCCEWFCLGEDVFFLKLMLTLTLSKCSSTILYWHPYIYSQEIQSVL